MLVFAFLRWETDIASIPGSLSEQLAFVREMPGGTVPIIVYSVIGVALVLLAIGPHRVQAWIKWASTGSSAPTVIQPSTAPSSPERDQLAQQVQGETYEEYLRRLCRELAQELFRFLDEQGYSRFEDPDDPAIDRRDDIALGLYNRSSLRPQVKNLLRKLKERSLYRPETLSSFDQQQIDNPVSLHRIERIANLLNDIGHDW